MEIIGVDILKRIFVEVLQNKLNKPTTIKSVCKNWNNVFYLIVKSIYIRPSGDAYLNFLRSLVNVKELDIALHYKPSILTVNDISLAIPYFANMERITITGAATDDGSTLFTLFNPLFNLEYLTDVSLCNCTLFTLKDIPMLDKLPKLRKLDLSGSTFFANQFTALLMRLNLTHLNLRATHIQNTQVKLLLRKMKSLEFLDITRNNQLNLSIFTGKKHAINIKKLRIDEELYNKFKDTKGMNPPVFIESVPYTADKYEHKERIAPNSTVFRYD
jgi:hypothetical protein